MSPRGKINFFVFCFSFFFFFDFVLFFFVYEGYSGFNTVCDRPACYSAAERFF